MSVRKILFLPRTGLAQDILSPRARTTLENLGQVVWNRTDRDYAPEELAQHLPGAEAVVTSWGSPAFTPDLLALADRLKIVGHAAGSVKHLMPKQGYDRGIAVLSAAAVIADSVAEYTLWAMLSVQRDLCRDGRASVAVVAPPDISVSIWGQARVVKDRMEAGEHYAVLEIDVEGIKNDMVRTGIIGGATTFHPHEQYQPWFDAALRELEAITP